MLRALCPSVFEVEKSLFNGEASSVGVVHPLLFGKKTNFTVSQ